MKPRDYQTQTMINPAREALISHRSVVVAAATGSGKTSVAAYMTRGAISRGKRVLTINHRPEIHSQFMQTHNAWGISSGQIASGRTMTREPSQVAMIQTLINRMDRLPWDFDMVIVDEAHHILEDNMWGKALRHPRLQNAVRIGFTATPQGRTNGAGLHPFFKTLIQGAGTLDLINDGWLVYPRIYKPAQQVAEAFRITRGDYDTKQQEEVFSRKKIVGDAIAHYRQYLDGLPTIVSCVSLKHAHDMQAQYEKEASALGKSWKGVMIEGGSTHRKARDEGIRGLSTGAVQLLFFVDVLGEGIDVPVCVGLQRLRKTTSLVLDLQFSGRILRPLWPENFNQYSSTRDERLYAISRSSKPYGVILDHAGNFYVHGHPITPRAWGLDDTKVGRGVEMAAPQITQCPKCNGVWPGRIVRCPGCGADIKEERGETRRNPQMIEGLLEEVGELTPEERKKLAGFAAGLMDMTPEEQRKRMLGALRYIDKERLQSVASAIGYKKNWTDVMYRRLNIKAPAMHVSSAKEA